MGFECKIRIRVSVFEGGNLRNAIARESFAVITFPEQYKENVRVDFNIYSAEMETCGKSRNPVCS